MDCADRPPHQGRGQVSRTGRESQQLANRQGAPRCSLKATEQRPAGWPMAAKQASEDRFTNDHDKTSKPMPTKKASRR